MNRAVRRSRAVAGAVLAGVLALGLGPSTAGAVEAEPLAPPPTIGAAEVPAGWPEPPPVSASSYLLLEASTGQTLAAREPDRRRPVASTVKILTALTVLTRLAPGHPVTIPPAAAAVGGASVGLDAGEVWTVGQLLQGLIARSGNDAATALALETAGGIDGFTALMREDAARLGLEGVQLSDPSGLDDRNLLSARDLGVITRAALRDPQFRALAGEREVALPGVGTVASRNALLGTYPGATGVKTGYTAAAGYSLVASAASDGRELVAVLLDSRSTASRFTEAAALLDFGFESFELAPVQVETRLAVAGSAVVLRSGPVTVAVPRGSPIATPAVTVPVEVTPAGVPDHATVRWDGAELARLPLSVVAPERPAVSGGATVGRALVDRAYAAMRAATTTGAWDASASLDDARVRE